MDFGAGILIGCADVVVFRGCPGGRLCGEAVVPRLLLGWGAASSRQFQASLEIAKADVRASKLASRAMQAALWVSKVTFISECFLVPLLYSRHSDKVVSALADASRQLRRHSNQQGSHLVYNRPSSLAFSLLTDLLFNLLCFPLSTLSSPRPLTMADAEVQELRAQLAASKLKETTLEAKNTALELEKTALTQITQDTTLDEFLRYQHELIYKRLEVQINPALATKGSLTAVQGRLCPTRLKPWTQFPADRQALFNEIHQAWNPPAGPIRHLTTLQGLQDGARIPKRIISSEKDLERFHLQVVQQNVELVLRSMCTHPSLKASFQDLGSGLEFHNQPHALNDGQPEVEARRQDPVQDSSKAKAPTQYQNAPRDADQFCITWKDNAARLVFIEELKAPHKLTQQFLDAILGDPQPDDELDVLAIRDFQTGCADPYSEPCSDPELLVASAATQTYSYMLPAGLAYGCIVTGEAIVFLHIDEDDPQTLLYHLALPLEDVTKDRTSPPNYALTAVAQMATFALMAFRGESRNPDWKVDAVKNAKKWVVDYAVIERLLKTPRKERRKSLKHSAFKGKGPSGPKSHRTRSKRHDKKDDDDNPDGNLGHGSTEHESPSKSKSDRTNKSNRRQGGQGSSSRKGEQLNEYCTQACLLGMVRHSAIDENCPNAAFHPRNKKFANLHLIGQKKFRKLIHNQLATTLNRNITDLRINGSRGMLFKLVLESHGYVFVGKGTIDVFVPDLRHEGGMYRRLESLQGTDIPVYLGNIDLVRRWYDLGICILHMLLLSFGGKMVDSLDRPMLAQIDTFRAKLDGFGIKHGDLENRNMLWNEELQRLVFIDFERSVVQPRSKPTSTTALQEITPNKLSVTKVARETTLPDMDQIASNNDSSACTHNLVKGAATTFDIFDDENTALELPIPSPKRLPPQAQSETTGLSPSKGIGHGRKLIGHTPVLGLLPDLSAGEITWPKPIR